MRAVLDTNVIVSAAINDASKPARLINLWQRGLFELAVSPALLHEYRNVLNYPHVRRAHNLTPDEVKEFLLEFDEADITVDATVKDRVVTADPDDDVVVATAVAGNANYIVSGDKHLLGLGEHSGIRIVTPAVFLAILEHDL